MDTSDQEVEEGPKPKRLLFAVRGTRLLIGVLALAIVATSVVWTAIHLRAPAQPSVAPEDQVVSYSTNTPDETKPGASYDWLGRPNDPKKIKIASIGVDAYLQKVGVDQDRNVTVPNNVHLGGWFVDSVRPGEKGLSIIDGHYDGRTQSEAIFKDLAKVKDGDIIVIEFGDGRTKAFAVSGVTTTTIKDAPSVLFSQDPQATNQLNLITCGGTYDRQGRTYDKRVIVSAQLQQG